MPDLLKVYCVLYEVSVRCCVSVLQILAVFRRSLVASNWWAGMSLASLTIRIFDNLFPLGTRLSWKSVMFLRIIEKMHGVIK